MGSSPTRATSHASAGHRRAPAAVTRPPSGCAGSTPARRTVARSSIGPGRQLLTLERGVQFPYGLLFRQTNDQVVELADTQRSERCARAGVGVQLSPWSLWCRRAGARPALIRLDCPARYRGLQLTRSRVRKQAKRPGREPGDRLWVQLPPRLPRAVSSIGRALVLQTKGCRFESCTAHSTNGAVAELGKHLPCTQASRGSSPLGSTAR